MKNQKWVSAREDSSKGFTFIELMLVVVIAGVLMGLAVPYFEEWKKDLEYREVTRHIVSILRYAQSRAITTNLEHRVEYEPENRRYRVIQGNRADNSSNWSTVVCDWFVLPHGVHLDTTVNTVHLNTNGTANGATIKIQDAEKMTKFEVKVANTGRVRVPLSL